MGHERAAQVLKGESPTHICGEARKILECVAGWRRVLRQRWDGGNEEEDEEDEDAEFEARRSRMAR
eukprot:5462019-Pyramimonas_sp.AAC.1